MYWYFAEDLAFLNLQSSQRHGQSFEALYIHTTALLLALTYTCTCVTHQHVYKYMYTMGILEPVALW